MSFANPLNKILNSYDFKLLASFYVMMFIYIVIADIIENRKKIESRILGGGGCGGNSCSNGVGSSMQNHSDDSDSESEDDSDSDDDSDQPRVKVVQQPEMKVVQPTNSVDESANDNRADAAKVVQHLNISQKNQSPPSHNDIPAAFNTNVCCGKTTNYGAPYPFPSPKLSKESLPEVKPNHAPSDGSTPTPFNAPISGCSLSSTIAKD